jgi:hypothetical protein
MSGEDPEIVLPPIPGLPERTLHTYARLWQLETWLRHLVYIECRARYADDWARGLNIQRAKSADKRLTHMPTPEESALSFAQLSDLRRIIDADWNLFETFLPPQPIWQAKLDEVAQVRHRVAHFRLGHRDDLNRVVQLLRDVDAGFWRFCTSYNDPHPVLPQSIDAVVSHFLHLDLIPWVQVQERQWARVGMADPSEPLYCTIEVLSRPSADQSAAVDGSPGRFYDVRVHARQGRRFDYNRYLETTTDLHHHLAHLFLDDFANELRVTLPCLLGSARIIPIVERLIEVALNCVRPGTGMTDERVSDSVEALADSMPEFIVGPRSPLAFLTPDMPCSIFGA